MTIEGTRGSELILLAGYSQAVVFYFYKTAGTIGIYPCREAKKKPQRAVVGLTDLSARVHFNRRLSANVMTFTVPLAMFDEMESNVKDSFPERHTWQNLVQGKE